MNGEGQKQKINLTWSMIKAQIFSIQGTQDVQEGYWEGKIVSRSHLFKV